VDITAVVDLYDVNPISLFVYLADDAVAAASGEAQPGDKRAEDEFHASRCDLFRQLSKVTLCPVRVRLFFAYLDAVVLTEDAIMFDGYPLKQGTVGCVRPMSVHMSVAQEMQESGWTGIYNVYLIAQTVSPAGRISTAICCGSSLTFGYRNTVVFAKVCDQRGGGVYGLE
jgi:hypothetical protein